MWAIFVDFPEPMERDINSQLQVADNLITSDNEDAFYKDASMDRRGMDVNVS